MTSGVASRWILPNIGSYLILIWLLIPPNGATTTCCQGDAKWVRDTYNCTNGRTINLFCEHGFLEVEQDNKPNNGFHIMRKGNESWLVIYNEHKISSDSYCLTIREDFNHSALICYVPDTWMHYKHIIFGYLSIISSIFFGLTLLTYAILPELRDVQDKAIMSATASFAVAYFILGIQNLDLVRFEQVGCLMMASLMYYAYMAAFCWLNIISFNVWRSIWFKTFRLPTDILYIIFCIYGWGLPLFLLGFSLTANHIEDFPLKPRFADETCWINGTTERWLFFYAPISLLLIMNLIYLSLTFWKLWLEYRGIGGNRLKIFRFRCLMYFKLVLIMGITWIFEVLSFASSPDSDPGFYWLPSDILNILQGLITFVVLVVSRRRIKKLLTKKKPCGIAFPKSWATYIDEENCEQAAPEEVDLSQSS